MNEFVAVLEEGEREGDAVSCPRHGSRFDLCFGEEVLRGLAGEPQRRFEARMKAGKIEVGVPFRVP